MTPVDSIATVSIWQLFNHPIPAHGVQRTLRSVFSDGHWIAYTSDESGSDEIYVREFSFGSAQGDAAGKWLISKGGGTDPRWRGDGKELFYVASDGKLMSVEISAKPVFQAGVPRSLFQLPLGFIGVEVIADGRRFLVGVPSSQARFPVCGASTRSTNLAMPLFLIPCGRI